MDLGQDGRYVQSGTRSGGMSHPPPFHPRGRGLPDVMLVPPLQPHQQHQSSYAGMQQQQQSSYAQMPYSGMQQHQSSYAQMPQHQSSQSSYAQMRQHLPSEAQQPAQVKRQRLYATTNPYCQVPATMPAPRVMNAHWQGGPYMGAVPNYADYNTIQAAPFLATVPAGPGGLHVQASPAIVLDRPPVTKKRKRPKEKKHKCTTCGKAFGTVALLSRHDLIHKGIRPFPCSECGKRFRQKVHLVKHIRLHTGERPHVCPHCGNAFTQKSTLTSHIRTKHAFKNGYACHYCRMLLPSPTALKTHISMCLKKMSFMNTARLYNPNPNPQPNTAPVCNPNPPNPSRAPLHNPNPNPNPNTAPLYNPNPNPNANPDLNLNPTPNYMDPNAHIRAKGEMMSNPHNLEQKR